MLLLTTVVVVPLLLEDPVGLIPNADKTTRVNIAKNIAPIKHISSLSVYTYLKIYKIYNFLPSKIFNIFSSSF